MLGLRIAVVGLGVAFGALWFELLAQQRRTEHLEAQLAQLRASQVSGPEASALRPVAGPGALQPARAAASTEAALPSTPRVAVGAEEVARVESAVLDLLESDHPELHQKLRAVVQQEQQSLEQERREERRERWATRREAQLLELGQGITDEQRRAILQIMLATRDQVSDLRDSVNSPEAINAVREQRRELRRQSEAQVQQLLTPQQYQAYQARFGDDDDDATEPPGEVRPSGRR